MPPGATGAAARRTPSESRIASGQAITSAVARWHDVTCASYTLFERRLATDAGKSLRRPAVPPCSPLPSSEVIHATASTSPRGFDPRAQLSWVGTLCDTDPRVRGDCPVLSIRHRAEPVRPSFAATNSDQTMMYLSDTEVADLCAPLTQPAAQVRYLRAVGLTVTLKPNGRPVVIRCHAEAVLSGRRVASPLATTEQPSGAKQQQPSRSSLVTLLQRGRANGTSKTSQPAEPAAARLR